MSAAALSEGRIEGARRPWKDPFVIAFVLGAIVLTILPFIQRLTLRAPPALGSLGAWSLQGASGDVVNDGTLRGKVWLAGFVPAACDAECQSALALFGRSVDHVRDMDGKIAVVTLVQPTSLALTAGAPGVVLSGEAAALEPVWSRFASAWDRQIQGMSGRSVAFLARPTFAVVDQEGAVRGFWPADDQGRGHAINAARMFARHGTEP